VTDLTEGLRGTIAGDKGLDGDTPSLAATCMSCVVAKGPHEVRTGLLLKVWDWLSAARGLGAVHIQTGAAFRRQGLRAAHDPCTGRPILMTC
jgi:hypothetical protein